MCLGFFQLTKRKNKPATPPFSRLTSDCSIQIHADNEYFPNSPVSVNSPSTVVEYSLDIPNSNTVPQLRRGYPKPLHFYNENEDEHFLIISTSYRHQTRSIQNGCVYLYNLSLNAYISVPYPRNFKPEYHGHCINTESSQLYIFFGRYGVFAMLDLYTYEWDIKCLNNESDSHLFDTRRYNIQNMWYPMSYYIPFPVNEMHMFGERIDGNGNGIHLKYSEFHQQFIKLDVSKDTMVDLEECKLCYIEHRKQLFILNGDIYGRKTYCLDFKNNDNNDREWKRLDIDKNSGDSVVLFDRFILIVRGDSIWCLDLDLNGSVWIESEFRLSGLLMEDTNMIKVTEFYLHFINLCYPNHTKLWFYCVLPCVIQCQLNRSIAFGYAKKEFSELVLMPKTIVEIMANYINLL